MITHDHRLRRLRRIRRKLAANLTLPRLTVFRSHRHLWVQIIDDRKGTTLLSASTKDLKTPSGTKTKIAGQLGILVGQKAVKAKINRVRFDRGLYLYHGRVKALADGARESGLKF